MSISMSARIKEKHLNQVQFENLLFEYFKIKTTIMYENENCVHYEGLFSRFGVNISFFETKTPPYNIYDSEILQDEFSFSQMIYFDIDKTGDILRIFHKAIDFSFFIYSKIETDLLLTSNIHNDICYINFPGKKVIARVPHLISSESLEKYNFEIDVGS